MLDPIAAEATPSVKPRTPFKEVLDNGTVIEGTAPFDTTIVPETKYYVCQIPNGSMFRPDGHRIGFVRGFYETNVKETQDYLDKEIRSKHLYVRHATLTEVQQFKAAENPKEFYTEVARETIQEELRAEFEAKLQAILNAPPGAPGATNLDADKLAGISALKERLAKPGVKSGTGTVFMTSEAAPLKGIVGSDAIASGAAGSSSTGKM